MADKKYAEIVKERTAAAIAVENAAKQGKEQTAADYRKRQFETFRDRLEAGGFEENYWPEWKASIDRAADNGYQRVNILLNTRRNNANTIETPREKALIEVGVKKLKDMGFNARIDSQPELFASGYAITYTHIYLCVYW
ncbi:MAG: hypothetical protein WCO23_01010 [bacterium]